MTYSILAIDREANLIGGAAQSHFFGVGGIVFHARPGVGIVATQAFANRSFGPDGVELLGRGWPADRVLEALLALDSEASTRQVAVMAADGQVVAATGEDCYRHAGHAIGDGVSAQGNMLATPGIASLMVAAFESAHGDLAERLLSALDAAEQAGGDARGQQSAALRIVSTDGGSVDLDLRVEDAERPLDELRRIVARSRAYAELGVIFEPRVVAGPRRAGVDEVDAALAAIERSLQHSPQNPEAYMWRYVVLARAGRPEAREAYDTAVALNPALAGFLDDARTDGRLDPGASAY